MHFYSNNTSLEIFQEHALNNKKFAISTCASYISARKLAASALSEPLPMCGEEGMRGST